MGFLRWESFSLVCNLGIGGIGVNVLPMARGPSRSCHQPRWTLE